MSERAGEISVKRCDHCHARFLSRPGRCPRCGNRDVVEDHIPARATVIAATELTVPPEGVPAPHPLLLLEGEEGVRILATLQGPLPEIGSVVEVSRSGDAYWVGGPAKVVADAPGAGADR